jgi:hypothetical protein
MVNIYLQYAFIMITLVVSIGYMVKLFKDTFSSRKKNCGGGANCKCGKE